MFDGAAAADAAHVAADAAAAHAAPHTAADAAAKAQIDAAPVPVAVREADPSKDNGKKEVVFIDTAVADYQKLVEAVRPGVEIRLIDTSQNGLAQIAKWAETHSDYDSIQIFSHGRDGVIALGGSTLSASTISHADIQAELTEIGHALKPDGDIHFYGCNVGQGTVGTDLIQAIAQATGADVAASTNATGPTRLGGDWTLEVATGTIDTAIALDTAKAENLSALLPLIGSNPSEFWARPGTVGTTWVETRDDSYWIVADGFAMGSLRGYFEWNNGSGWHLLHVIFKDSVSNGGTDAPKGATIRYVDTRAGDATTEQGVYSGYGHQGSNPGTATSGGKLAPDTPPTDITPSVTTVAIGTPTGGLVATAYPTDVGAVTGGLWVVESQSVANLFTVSAADRNALNINLGTGTLPPPGQIATITLRYYDQFQLDSTGAPIVGEGVSRTLSFTVVGQSRDLAFTDDAGVNTHTAGEQMLPSVTRLSNDNFVVVWTGHQDANGSYGIYGRIYNKEGVAQGGEFAIASTTIEEYSPVVTALSGGRFVVAYGDATNGNILYRMVAADGTVGAPVTVSAGGDWDSNTNLAITTLTDGNFLISWGTNTYKTVSTAKFDGTTGVQIGSTSDITVTGSNSLLYPAIAALSDGNHVSAASDGTQTKVWINGGAAFSIGDGDATPSLVGLVGGGFVLVWKDASWMNIYAQRYDNAGVAQGSPISVNTASTTGVSTPRVAALTDGGFVVSWDEVPGDGNLAAVKGRRFDATGTAVDAAEFQINQNPYGTQASAAVAALPFGAFVTVWTDTIPDGTNSEIEVRVTLVNHAPVLTDTALALAPVAFDATSAPSGAVGTQISNLVSLSGNVADVDSGAVTGIALMTTDTTNGSWYYSQDAGNTWWPVGTVSATNALLLQSTDRLYFRPNGVYTGGSTPAAITFKAWDQSVNMPGTRADTTSNGGSTALSVLTESASLQVTAAPPTITSATYNASTNVLTVTGTGMTAGDTINTGKLTITGQGGATYTLTSANVTAASDTSFSVTLNAADQVQVERVLNKTGTSAQSGTYNIAAADDWDSNVTAGDTSDTTGNAITVSNANPNGTFDFDSGTVTGSGTAAVKQTLGSGTELNAAGTGGTLATNALNAMPGMTGNSLSRDLLGTDGGSASAIQISAKSGETFDLSGLKIYNDGNNVVTPGAYDIVVRVTASNGASFDVAVSENSTQTLVAGVTSGFTLADFSQISWFTVTRVSGGINGTVLSIAVDDVVMSNITAAPAGPSVSSITRSSGSGATSATTMSYDVTFSSAVSGVDNSDFTLTNVSGTPGGTIASVTDSGDHIHYTVSVTGISGDGTQRLDLKSSGTGITAQSDNAAITGGYTSGATVAFDHTAPNPPSAVTMSAGSDHGSSHSDGVTNATTPTITGTAEANATVTLYDSNGTTVLGTTTADGSGAWSITASTLSSGSHTLTAKATDAAGNVSSVSSGLAVIVDTAAPTDITPSATVASASGATNGATFCALSASDPTNISGFADGWTYAVTGGTDSGKFSVTGSNLVINNAGGLSVGSYSVEVTATDKAGNSVAKTLSLSVAAALPIDLNGTTAGTGTTVALANAAAGLATAATPGDSGGSWNNDTLTVQRVTASGTADGNRNDIFNFNSGVTANRTITRGQDISDGTLTVSGVQVATWTYTSATGRLVVTFNASADDAAVTAVTRSIGYSNATPYGNATVRFAMNNGSAISTADAVVTSSTIYVDQTAYDTDGDGADGFNLAEALAKASDGDTILIEDGTYRGQFIATKAVTIDAVNGAGHVTLEAPNTADITASAQSELNNRLRYAILDLRTLNPASGTVTVRNITVDGRFQAPDDGTNGNDDMIGIATYDTNAVIDGVTVKGIASTIHANGDYSGNSENFGILAEGCAAHPVTVTVRNSTIDTFQKTGIVAWGAGLTVNIQNNIITAVGTLGASNQNAMQIGSAGARAGTLATITGNTINNLGSNNGVYSATGIMLRQAGVSEVGGNVIRSSGTPVFGGATTSICIYEMTASVNIHDNDLGNTSQGILVESPLGTLYAGSHTMTNNNANATYLAVIDADDASSSPTNAETITVHTSGAVTNGRGFLDYILFDGNDHFTDTGSAPTRVDGGAGNDILTTGSGNDELIGGDGADILTGGAGSDKFFVGNGDTIRDLTTSDSIRLAGLTVPLSRMTVTASGADAILAIDSDGNGSTDITVTLTGLAGITVNDLTVTEVAGTSGTDTNIALKPAPTVTPVSPNTNPTTPRPTAPAIPGLPSSSGDVGSSPLHTIVRDNAKSNGGTTTGTGFGLAEPGPSSALASQTSERSAFRAETTASSGSFFQVAVATKAAGAPDALIVNQRITDSVVPEGTRLWVQIPTAAFADTRTDTRVTLVAIQANGRSLPGWMTFNPQTGTFEGQPPPGFKGEVVVKVIARDTDGREAAQIFKIHVGEGTQGKVAPQGEGRPQASVKPVGKLSLTEQLRSMSKDGRLAEQAALFGNIMNGGKAA
jgi:hypothetical protein